MDAVQGGPLFVPRQQQGAGRHDSPDRFGTWYCARDPVSAVAESIAFARGQRLEDDDFVTASGAVRSLVSLWLDDEVTLVDLDDPQALATRRLRPSEVATRRRTVTQRIATSLFDEGATGFLWWSRLEAEWINATLFHERARPHVSVVARPRRLSVRLPEVREAAARLGVDL